MLDSESNTVTTDLPNGGENILYNSQAQVNLRDWTPQPLSTPSVFLTPLPDTTQRKQSRILISTVSWGNLLLVCVMRVTCPLIPGSCHANRCIRWSLAPLSILNAYGDARDSPAAALTPHCGWVSDSRNCCLHLPCLVVVVLWFPSKPSPQKDLSMRVISFILDFSATFPTGSVTEKGGHFQYILGLVYREFQ